MKKILSVCLAVILLLACIPMQSFAEGSPVFAAGNAEANPGDTVEIPILIENNPGIVALIVSVSYDADVLTLQGATSASLFSEGDVTFTGSSASNTDPFRIVWYNALGTENSTESGTLATLTFLVKEDAPVGEASIAVSYSPSSVFDINLDNVEFGTRDGVVSIVPAEVGGWSFTEDSELYTFEADSGLQFVCGLDFLYPVVSDYVETTGGWTFEVVTNEYDMESTGAKLVIYDENGEAVEEYYAVLFGDINGDGVIDLMDISLQADAMGYILDEPWSDFVTTDEYPNSFAADPNHDLVLDLLDVSFILDHMGGLEDIDQSQW